MDAKKPTQAPTKSVTNTGPTEFISMAIIR
jgi:hypothetical protein